MEKLRSDIIRVTIYELPFTFSLSDLQKTIWMVWKDYKSNTSYINSIWFIGSNISTTAHLFFVVPRSPENCGVKTVFSRYTEIWLLYIRKTRQRSRYFTSITDKIIPVNTSSVMYTFTRCVNIPGIGSLLKLIH